MKKALSFASQKEHYTADACVIWCFDDRFYKLLKAFGKKEGFGHIDLVKAAGGAKALAGGSSPERDFLLGEIKSSIRLHDTKRVILMVHRDCGGYGGSKNFSDAVREREELGKQSEIAKRFVGSEVPNVSVDAYFADFDGLYEI